MKKVFKLQDLGCANCAAKMENSIKKLDGVKDVRIAFMTQKLTLDAEDSRFEEILDQACRICSKFEPDMVILR